MKNATQPARRAPKYAAAVLVAAVFAAFLLAACEPEKTSAAPPQIPTLSVFYSCAAPAATPAPTTGTGTTTTTTTAPVLDPADEITSIALAVGETKQLTAETSAATWSSDDATIVTVSGTGELTAVAAGTAVVTASAAGLQDARIPVAVVAANGTPSPITLKTEGDLRLIGCADGVDRLRAAYTLANDITLTKEWEPLGTFGGTLDGAGYSIKNLVINKPSAFYVGLVSQNDGSITNIGIEIGAAGIIGQDYVGALTGTNKGTVHAIVGGPGAVNGRASVGGLAGDNGSKVVGVVLTDVRGAVSANGLYIGGLVGNNAGGGSVVVFGYATGNITGYSRVGGVFGYSDAGAVAGYHTRGSVTGGAITAGAVGQINGGSFSGYARSAVTVSLPAQAGKVVGFLDPNTTTVNAYYSGKTGESELKNSGGTPNNTGTAITITATTTEADFSGLTFGTAEGEWTFHPGKWPSINLPADKIFDPYRGALQPIDP